VELAVTGVVFMGDWMLESWFRWAERVYAGNGFFCEISLMLLLFRQANHGRQNSP
jgi:hypothetical protein